MFFFLFPRSGNKNPQATQHIFIQECNARPEHPLQFSLYADVKKMSKNTTESSSNAPSALLGLFLSSISLTTVVMNILVLCAVKTEKKLQTVGNLYIVSLSVADLMVGAAVMPLNIVYLLSPAWPLGLAACLFWLSVDYVASTASIFNLFILCVDRYRSVRRPLRYLRYRTKMRASLLILGAWLLSLTWLIPILGWHVFANNGRRTVAGDKCETEFSEVTWFKVLTAIFNFYLPSLLMLWFYCKIFRAVRKHCQNRQLPSGSSWASLEQNPGQAKRCSERKAARQLGVIMAAFMLCWIPYFVLFMVKTFHKQLSELHMVTIWLGYVNSTLNPFLYPLWFSCSTNCHHPSKKGMLLL
uniref:Histamine H1 receptor n=1 Tax=Malurus cyaneus samueli TaxID=2593467 RepID=A0A8C5U811_9PASS